MRGDDRQPDAMFSYVSAEQRVPQEHPLRAIRALVDDVLRDMSREFDGLYARVGRPSIPPERLLRAQLLQIFYSVRSERLLMEQLDYNLLFRWFVGLAIDDAVWEHSVFSKNRDRLLENSVVEAFFGEVMRLAEARGLVSKEHFSVDGTLIQAWASHKSFKPKDGSDDQRPGGPGRNTQADWKGRPRSNDTHESTTDPDARLYRKSHNAAAILCYQGHLLMEHRNGLAVSAITTHATGSGEREAALVMLDALPGRHARTLGADKGYDTNGFVAACRERNVTPHIARNDTRRGGSAIDARTTRHPGYAISQIVRKRIEEHFGWGKTIGRIRQTVYRGLRRVDQHFKLTMTASNLVRIARISIAVPQGVAA
jgi:transposase